MATLQDYINQVQTLVHDTNGANFSIATLTSFINQARTRVAMDTHCVRNFLSVTGGSALNTIPLKENYIYNGTLGGITIDEPGEGYDPSLPPAVIINGGGGDFAQARSVVNAAGQVAGANVTNWGSGFSSAPDIFFELPAPGGVQATGHATVLTNVLDILGITVIWGDERIEFGWCNFTMFQTFFRQFVNNYNVPAVFTIHQGVQQVFMFQIPDQAYTMEWDIITLPAPLVNPNDADSEIISPWNDAVQFYAAFMCSASLQNYTQAKFWHEPKSKSGIYDCRVLSLPATAFSRRIYNPYRTYLKRLRRM